MTALEARLKEMIAAEGPIGVDRYMTLALSDPRDGYYMTRDPFGPNGDFVTAPEISQIFGELIGAWTADLWHRMGRPSPLRLIELGPGRGALLADALRVAGRLEGFSGAVDPILIETSPSLSEIQRLTLARQAIPASWFLSLEEAPPGPAIIIANEFLDALPIRQFVRAAERWNERQVGLDANGRLAFGLNPAPADIAIEAPAGVCIELGAEALALVHEIARRLVAQGGCALFVDYGATAGFGDTLQALRRGAPADPLAFPGESDLTAQVNFTVLAEAARRAGARVHGPAEQASFLMELGLKARLARLAREASASQRTALEAGAQRLIDRSTPTAMGTLFKALAICAPEAPIPAGFGELR